MKPALKYSLVVLAMFIVASPVLFLGAVSMALRAHARHDVIISEGQRVQAAISEYSAKHGQPPQRLQDLVPECLPALPAIPEISKMDYRLSPDGKEWTLDLYRTNRNALIIYRRTNAPLSAEDKKRVVGTEKGCYVLKME